jgi:DNA-binding transcriptional ArsR family regulator
MSYGRRDRPDPADGGWAGLAEWTGGLPPEQIQALAAVRPLEAVHSLLRGLAGRTPRELLARAAVLEALSSGKDDALSWLAEPARGETLRALRRGGWLEPGPDEPPVLTAIGRRVWGALRHAASPAEGAPLLPDVITPERIVRALLALSLEDLAAAGREALLPVLAAPPLLTTLSVAKDAEAQAVTGGGDEEEGPGDRPGGRNERKRRK